MYNRMLLNSLFAFSAEQEKYSHFIEVDGLPRNIILPSGKGRFSNNEFVVYESQDHQLNGNENFENFEINSPPYTKKYYNLPGILVIEDNMELREYLAGHFNKKYKVHIAEDGLEGLKLAKETDPDIILTDVQIPHMNGYEFCKKLRRNFDTSHIPVIMLDTNNTIEHHIEGLSAGADAYIGIPFDIQLLDAQVYSLLENRKTLRNKFHGIDTAEYLEKKLPRKDMDFILNLKLFIEENIMNQELSVVSLSEHFTVSLAQFYRKVKSLTGSTPNNLIKSIRLKRAYNLIREGGLRVSEAAYRTGFSDPNYFSICFKKEFGKNPSQIGSSIKDLSDWTDIESPPNVAKPEILIIH